MSKKFLFLTILLILTFSIGGCAGKKNEVPPAQDQGQQPTQEQKPTDLSNNGQMPDFPKTNATKATIETDKGTIELELYPKDAPTTVANFVYLAKAKFFDGLTFHRVEPNFVVQGGDPTGTGAGGPGYSIPEEINPQKHVKGAVGMATQGTNTNTGGSQFYITLRATPELDNNYTVFGKVVRGMDVVEKMAVGDKMKTVRIED